MLHIYFLVVFPFKQISHIYPITLQQLQFSQKIKTNEFVDNLLNF